MAKLRVSLLSEVIQSLPEIQPFNPAAGDSKKRAALFCCALGFEERCLELPAALAEHGFIANHARYFRYSTNLDDNETNRQQLVHHLKAISEDVASLESDESGFPNQLRELMQSVISESGEDEPLIVFDLSVAANRLLMRCFKVFLEFDVRLEILYSEARVYHPTKEEYEEDSRKWSALDAFGIERGISDVSISEEYPGYHIDQLPDSVVLFSSIKKVRSLAIINKVDPSLVTSPGDKVIWLIGVPHSPDDRWIMDAMKEIIQLGPNTPCYEVSTFDYREALSRLDSIYEERVEHRRLTLSPMGSNMQAVGAALFCYLRPAVRVIFAVPEEYNAVNYSEGCKARWAINFGSLKDVRAKLDQVGMLAIEV